MWRCAGTDKLSAKAQQIARKIGKVARRERNSQRGAGVHGKPRVKPGSTTPGTHIVECWSPSSHRDVRHGMTRRTVQILKLGQP